MLAFFLSPVRLALALLSGWAAPQAEAPAMLKPDRWVAIRRLPEPSDLCLTADGQGFWVASDNGLLFRTDLEGHVVAQSPDVGNDFEAVALTDSGVIVMDESRRRLLTYNPTTLRRTRTAVLPYAGARNKGVEGLTYNPVRHMWLAATERDPALLLELNAQFQQVNEQPWKLTSDISALTFHAGAVWVLADEDRTLVRLDARDYTVTGQWRLPILNPEGLAFLPDGRLVIVSDDLARLYFFPALP